MELFRNESSNLHREHGPAVVTKNLIQYVVNGRLHRADGPAVISSNGGKTFYWKGIFIEPSLWAGKDTMPATDILKLPNAEVRRCMVEMIGYENFIKRAEAKIIDEDKKAGSVLYRVEMPDDDKEEPLVVIKVTDGTPFMDKDGKEKRKEYFLRVPPATLTCLEAVAWTFDMDPKEYAAIEQET